LRKNIKIRVSHKLSEQNKKAVELIHKGLPERENEKGYLTGTCLDGQNTFKTLVGMFENYKE